MKSEHWLTGLPTSTPEQNVADYEWSCCKMSLTCEEPGMNMSHSLNTLGKAMLFDSCNGRVVISNRKIRQYLINALAPNQEKRFNSDGQ